MDGFISWQTLIEYASFVTMVFTVVEFTKEMPFIKKIPTKYWSAIVSFTLLLIANLHDGSFATWDIVLYILSSIVVSLGSNGLANFNKKLTATKEGDTNA